MNSFFPTMSHGSMFSPNFLKRPLNLLIFEYVLLGMVIFCSWHSLLLTLKVLPGWSSAVIPSGYPGLYCWLCLFQLTYHGSSISGNSHVAADTPIGALGLNSEHGILMSFLLPSWNVQLCSAASGGLRSLWFWSGCGFLDSPEWVSHLYFLEVHCSLLYTFWCACYF